MGKRTRALKARHGHRRTVKGKAAHAPALLEPKMAEMQLSSTSHSSFHFMEPLTQVVEAKCL